MVKIDWRYHRNNCVTCGKADAFLTAAKLAAAKQDDARKHRLGEAEALQMARAAQHVYVARGKSYVHLDMKKDKPDDATLVKLLIGPSGNLRAPTLRVGKSLIVGFHDEMYKELLS